MDTGRAILLLGGYGGFGARIARRLAEAGYEVLVAGRSGERAARCCAERARLTPLVLNRLDVADALGRHRPALVVDASGPFQAMDYRVPEACIAAGIPYCDIADGRAFVCGIARLDAAARRAGVAVISGASSVPALSGAVVRHLAAGMDRVRAVDMAISASNRASAGPAVTSAILGQVGQPLTLRRGGRWVRDHGWRRIGRQDFFVDGVLPITRRLVALADVPDLVLLPDRLPGCPAVRFRAGAELGSQNLALWASGWLVRCGMAPNLSGLAPYLRAGQRLTSGLGGDRSAMIVRVFGDKGDERMERAWTLIAQSGDGPDIPALSVPLLVARILSGREPPGARDAGSSLSLEDFAPAFAGLDVHQAAAEFAARDPLYRRVMGAAFDRLPLPVRAIHDVVRDDGATGEAEVEGGANRLARLVAQIMRFPPAGKHPLHVAFAEADGVETWTRDFDGRRFSSRLSQSGSQLVERFGPLRFRFDLPADATGLNMAMRGWSAFGLPLPLSLAPRSPAREWAEGERFCFDVPIDLPFLGRIVRYRGWLKPVRP